MTSISSVIHQILLKKLNETSDVLFTIDVSSNRQVRSFYVTLPADYVT